MSHAFYADAEEKFKRRNRLWYQNNLLQVLRAAKEKQAREIDVSIGIAEDLMRVCMPKKVDFSLLKYN